MKVNVINKVKKEINVTINDVEDGVEIIIDNMTNMVQLSELKLWDVFYDSDGDSWVVTDIFNDSVEITKSHLLQKAMFFGKSNNYAESNCREFLNTEYVKEVERKFGSENILKHEVDLTSMDGFTDYGTVEDTVSIRTFDQYRKQALHFELEKNCMEWLVTPNQTVARGDTSCVQIVDSSGGVDYCDCYCNSYGVRPVLHLKSSIFVSMRKPND